MRHADRESPGLGRHACRSCGPSIFTRDQTQAQTTTLSSHAVLAGGIRCRFSLPSSDRQPACSPQAPLGVLRRSSVYLAPISHCIYTEAPVQRRSCNTKLGSHPREAVRPPLRRPTMFAAPRHHIRIRGTVFALSRTAHPVLNKDQ